MFDVILLQTGRQSLSGFSVVSVKRQCQAIMDTTLSPWRYMWTCSTAKMTILEEMFFLPSFLYIYLALVIKVQNMGKLTAAFFAGGYLDSGNSYTNFYEVNSLRVRSKYK
jgi:hypothetical protein